MTEKPISQEIRSDLRRRRWAQNLSVAELAGLAGVSRETLGAFLGGHRRRGVGNPTLRIVDQVRAALKKVEQSAEKPESDA